MPEATEAPRRELPGYRKPIDEGGACRIDYPIQLTGFSGNIDVKPAATLRCEMALSMALWTKNDLAPAARQRYWSGIKTIHQGSSYSCRRIRGSAVASEHSKGNALDIMRIELKNGRDIDVRKPGWFAFRQRGLSTPCATTPAAISRRCSDPATTTITATTSTSTSKSAATTTAPAAEGLGEQTDRTGFSASHRPRGDVKEPAWSTLKF